MKNKKQEIGVSNNGCKKGDIKFDLDNNKMYEYDGKQWVHIGKIVEDNKDKN